MAGPYPRRNHDRGLPSGARCRPGWKQAERAIEFADRATADDLKLLVLMSGGASAATGSLPASGVSFADKQAVTRALLRSGAHIGEINTVRKHSRALRADDWRCTLSPAKLVTIRRFPMYPATTQP